MAFIARKGKKGGLEVHGLEEFIEQKFAELKAALGLATGKAPGRGAKAARSGRAATAAPEAAGPVDALEAALTAHAKGAALAKAGKKKDQLYRSLAPLYLARGTRLEVSSGAVSKFWAAHGVRFAAPNAAKALREHPGHSTRTRRGPVITPKGIAYVEAVLAGRPAKR